MLRRVTSTGHDHPEVPEESNFGLLLSRSQVQLGAGIRVRLSHSFVYLIPFELPASDYYIARWAVTDDRRRLINGEFKFAFGAGALPPSEIIAARVSDLEEELPATGSYR